MDKQYKVIHYKSSEDVTSELLQKGFIEDLSTTQNKHFKFFDEYFRYHKIQTVVLEYEYIDKDYLDDYSFYYSKCFINYPKKCCRAHFFKSSFSKVDFEREILNNFGTEVIKAEETKCKSILSNSNYVGFIVFRPIPLTLIGRTCLRPYCNDNGDYNREYLIVHNYKVNLFGKTLHVRSLAFQEQDRAVSACATSALWSAFQSTGVIFHHSFPSPYEITKSATKYFQLSDTSFPNKGLMLSQMAHAIRAVNLESLTVGFINRSYMKAFIYAFIRGNIPVIIGMNLIDHRKLTKPIEIDFHAVTSSGYALGLDEGSDIPFEIVGKQELFNSKKPPNLFLRSSRMKKIYVHDDQIGPYSRIIFDDPKSQDEVDYCYRSLATHWSDLEPKYEHVRAYPNALLIPIYNKIRIPYVSILQIVIELNFCVNYDLFTNNDSEAKKFIVWDIYLATVSDLKSNLRKENFSSPVEKLNFLTSDLPKYLWVVDGIFKNVKVFSFIFDATDIEHGKMFLLSIHYDSPNSLKFKSIFNILRNKPEVFDSVHRKVQIILESYSDIKI